MDRNIEIIGGGTVIHIRNHLSLSAIAYGSTAKTLDYLVKDRLRSYDFPSYNVNLHLTKMANGGQGKLETNEDISNLIDKLILNHSTKIIFFSPALVRMHPASFVEKNDNFNVMAGPFDKNISMSKHTNHLLMLTPTIDILSKIRKEREDIFLSAFEITYGANEDEQFIAGIDLIKSTKCNLVLVNDSKTRMNMIVTSGIKHTYTTNRTFILRTLVDIALKESNTNKYSLKYE